LKPGDFFEGHRFEESEESILPELRLDSEHQAQPLGAVVGRREIQEEDVYTCGDGFRGGIS